MIRMKKLLIILLYYVRVNLLRVVWAVDLTYDNTDGYTLHTELLTGDNVFATEAGKEYMYTVTLNKTK